MGTMGNALSHWWDRLAIQRKVWMVLIIVVVPMLAILVGQATLIYSLVDTHHIRERTLLAQEQTQELRRLTIDIEDAFRGYLITEDPTFLLPLAEAERQLDETLARGSALLDEIPGAPKDLSEIGSRIHVFLASKHQLLSKVEAGKPDEAVEYVRSGHGLQLSDRLRLELHEIDHWLHSQVERLEQEAVARSTEVFWGLMTAVGAGLVLGIFGVRQLTQSLTEPLEVIRGALLRFARERDAQVAETLRTVSTADEIGDLARSSEEMMARISANIHELQVLHHVSLEISTIRPCGLDAVLQRIADLAVSPMRADACLVLSRHDSMCCWIVEAASGHLVDQLRKTVMLWEELPTPVRAYETKQPSIGVELRKDTRPEMVRRNLIADSMLAVPLLSHGASFGVMAFPTVRAVPAGDWNVRMAESLAAVAAAAINNARLYDAAYQQEKRIRHRLRQLEHLGESLAHDLKGPAERMAGLGGLLRREIGGEPGARVQKLLDLISQNGTEVKRRVEQILSLAQVGGRQETLEAVDPTLVLDDIFKARASELETAHVRVTCMPGLPPVACHRAYLHQIFDNLISNAIKFSRGVASPTIAISVERVDNRAVFSVVDNGPGIPAPFRERIFDPFVRLDPSNTEGTGIGLAIVRRIVELYEGRVWVEEAGAGGCCVRFTLPILGSLEGPEKGRASVDGGSDDLPAGETRS